MYIYKYLFLKGVKDMTTIFLSNLSLETQKIIELSCYKTVVNSIAQIKINNKSMQ